MVVVKVYHENFVEIIGDLVPVPLQLVKLPYLVCKCGCRGSDGCTQCVYTYIALV